MDAVDLMYAAALLGPPLNIPSQKAVEALELVLASTQPHVHTQAKVRWLQWFSSTPRTCFTHSCTCINVYLHYCVPASRTHVPALLCTWPTHSCTGLTHTGHHGVQRGAACHCRGAHPCPCARSGPTLAPVAVHDPWQHPTARRGAEAVGLGGAGLGTRRAWEPRADPARTAASHVRCISCISACLVYYCRCCCVMFCFCSLCSLFEHRIHVSTPGWRRPHPHNPLGFSKPRAPWPCPIHVSNGRRSKRRCYTDACWQTCS